MKNKILIIFLFILFAIPIPVAMLGSLLTSIWFVSSIIKESSYIEIIMSLFGMVIGITYFVTYIYSLIKTIKNKKISFTQKELILIALYFKLTADEAFQIFLNYRNNSRLFNDDEKKTFDSKI